MTRVPALLLFFLLATFTLLHAQTQRPKVGLVLSGGGAKGLAHVGVLKAMEEAGTVRRGYFIAGLGAAQFAVPGAVDRLRSMREGTDDGADGPTSPLVLAAADPAQPYGAALPWPISR